VLLISPQAIAQNDGGSKNTDVVDHGMFSQYITSRLDGEQIVRTFRREIQKMGQEIVCRGAEGLELNITSRRSRYQAGDEGHRGNAIHEHGC